MSNAELIAALDRLDSLFSDESKWTQQAYARDAAGRSVDEGAESATCWCLSGALYRIFPFGKGRLELRVAVRDALMIGGIDGIIPWNDRPSRTFSDVKKLIADARARLEAA